MRRYVVLFAREPAREAREKGFPAREGADLFAAFATGWLEAGRRAGAAMILATPAEDRATWRRRLPRMHDLLWVTQRGDSFGARLELAAKEAAALGGLALLVGGDVAPSEAGLSAAFEALERHADAVLAPSEDGGVSLIGVAPEDVSLLRGVAPRRRNAFASLSRALAGRGRRVAVVSLPRDIDGPRDLRALLRRRAPSPELATLARRALAASPPRSAPPERRPGSPPRRALPPLRAPPRAA